MAESAPSSAARRGTLMEGKRGVIMGAANNRSLAWGIAEACAAQGAELAFTYQGEAFKRRLRPLSTSIGADLLVNCDVADDASIDAAFETIGRCWDRIDFVVHAIAYADKQYLRGLYVETPRAAFQQALDISCYSLVAVSRKALPLMRSGASILTLSYYGAEKWVPHYNVMGVAKAALEASVRYLAADLGSAGIRVNAISAGPIKTLAAAGISDFHYLLHWNEVNAPLRRNVSIQDVGSAGLYLLSDLANGVTGEVHHVDSGYHIIGMKNPEAPDISVPRE